MPNESKIKEEYFEAGLVKLIATRFAKASKDKDDWTSNDRITHFEEWFAVQKHNFKSQSFADLVEQTASKASLIAELQKCDDLNTAKIAEQAGELERLKEQIERVKYMLVQGDYIAAFELCNALNK